jgi:murein DD-endopeptidase MepM/ murein hydrolase activator NlpD
VSFAPFRHEKSSRASSRPFAGARHRERTLIPSTFGRRPALIATVAGTVILTSAGAALAVSWPAPSAHPAGTMTGIPRAESAASRPGHLGARQRSDSPAASSAVHRGRPTRLTAQPTPPAKARAAAAPIRTDSKSWQAKALRAAPSVYRNPLREIPRLRPERVDMGTDFGGSGPIYAIGDAVVTNAMANSVGWPGGGWITYRLTSGPAAGLQVYVAEDVQPAVQVGQHVTSNTVVANMFAGGAGIETGWAMADGSSAESQLPEAGGIDGAGPFPTRIGLNFDELLIALGAPAGFGYTQSGGYGTVPSIYPGSWAGLRAGTARLGPPPACGHGSQAPCRLVPRAWRAQSRPGRLPGRFPAVRPHSREPARGERTQPHGPRAGRSVAPR